MNLEQVFRAGGGHVHLVGICGMGMAGLGVLLKAGGFKVTGCDSTLNARMVAMLEDNGIKVESGHDVSHMDAGVDWVVRSAAVSSDAPEMVRAENLGLPVFPRGVVLARLIMEKCSVAVGGTHGKTTTTSFIVQLLQKSGRAPSWCTGVESGFGGGAGAGSGDVIVVEADESDGTIAGYESDIAVITNVELDHMEHFKSEAALEDCFRRFAGNAKRKVVFGADDPRAVLLSGGLKNTVSFGFSDKADVRAVDLNITGSSLSFMLIKGGESMGRLDLPVTGAHNALNALAASAVAFELGLNFEEIQSAFRIIGLPRRRFDRIAEANGITVISDYAHHPSEIKALVRAAGGIGAKRLVAVFQPHRYSRTLALKRDFPAVFDGVDEVILAPVYAASEQLIAGGTMWDLYEEFRKHRQQSGRSVFCATSLREAWGYLRGELRSGDVLLIVGAGDVEKIGEWAKEEMSGLGAVVGAGKGKKEFADLTARLSKKSVVRFDEPLAGKTTLKVGGKADVWVSAASVDDLIMLLKWAREHGVFAGIMGAGSNVLVSDLGVRGIIVQLSGDGFSGIREENGIVIAGSGVSMAKLLFWLTDEGLGGLEFMEGIPGSVGGCLRMNAGAMGHGICERTEWIRYLNEDGSQGMVKKPDFGHGYRRCDCLAGRIVIEAGFKLVRCDKEEIKASRLDMSKRREWMKGMRSAGSVFLNPAVGDGAGKLIDKAGLKGCEIGRAMVSREHGNVIITKEGAMAADVMALMELVRRRVEERFGVSLKSEIVFLGTNEIIRG